MRSLTARIDEALKEVTLNYETWEDARLIARAADLYRRRAPELPGRGRLSEGFVYRRAFLEGYQRLRERHPERVAAAAEAVREYDRLLRAFGLRDDQVAAAYPPSPVLRFVIKTLLRLLLHLPIAVVGTVLNYPVYRIVGPLVRRLTRDPDQVATLKVIGSFFLFPLAWIAEGWLAGHYFGGWIGAAVALAAPLTGYGALLFHDRRTIFSREARAYLILRTRKRLAAELKARREAVLRKVEELEDLYSRSAALPDGGRLPPPGELLPLVGATFPLKGEVFPHEGDGFPHEGAALPLEGAALPHEGESFPHKGADFPHEGGAFPPEGDNPPPEGDGFPHEGENRPLKGEKGR